jgi:hypothetical protein
MAYYTIVRREKIQKGNQRSTEHYRKQDWKTPTSTGENSCAQ